MLLETGHDVHEAFSVLGLPTTIIVNPDGSICSRHIGFTRKATFESALERLLGKKGQCLPVRPDAQPSLCWVNEGRIEWELLPCSGDVGT